MQAKILSSLCKIVSRISNPSSLTSLYKSIEIGPESVRCCSEFGNLEMTVSSTGFTTPVLLDAGSVGIVASTLPPDGEINFTEKENKINWSCGTAKGHINAVLSDHTIPKIDHPNHPWAPPSTLSDALLLSSSACQIAAVSLGLYGITIQAEGDKLYLVSTNSISLASVTIDKGTFPVEKITLRPPVPAVMAALISSCPNCLLDITSDGIFITGDWLKAHLPLGTNLDHDVKAIADKFVTANHVAKIDSKAVKMFINRARSLTDKHANFTVKLSVQQGNLVLEHSGISSSTSEYFLASGLDNTLDFASKTFPADMLLLPLQFVQTVVFDYLESNQIVMTGDNPSFKYIIAGE